LGPFRAACEEALAFTGPKICRLGDPVVVRNDATCSRRSLTACASLLRPRRATQGVQSRTKFVVDSGRLFRLVVLQASGQDLSLLLDVNPVVARTSRVRSAAVMTYSWMLSATRAKFPTKTKRRFFLRPAQRIIMTGCRSCACPAVPSNASSGSAQLFRCASKQAIRANIFGSRSASASERPTRDVPQMRMSTFGYATSNRHLSIVSAKDKATGQEQAVFRIPGAAGVFSSEV